MQRTLAFLPLLCACTTGDDAAGPDAGDDPTCTQAADFLDVSTGSAGADYPDPELSVTCDDDEVIVESNGIPNVEFEQVTPNALQEHDHVFRLPRVPAPAAATTAVPLGGEVAVAVNGMMIFGPTEAPQAGYRDPILDQLMDYCQGHTAPGGMYHYHARPDCLFTDPSGETALVVGYALDGYPILWGGDVTSSWQRIAEQFDADGDPIYDNTPEGSWDVHEYVAGSGDLDECNGRELAGGGYAYYATDTFPYFLGCYRGTPNL